MSSRNPTEARLGCALVGTSLQFGLGPTRFRVRVKGGETLFVVVDSAYAKNFVIASKRCQYVYPYSYPFKVHFDIVWHDAPAFATATSFAHLLPTHREDDNEETEDVD
ncbi:hypothetical protein PanWU01x14_303910 [Parasponia andersonii]|uniref:Uncharacterized protein n=1 Tax=Parasponia andersonii TaxID=3476 RepID=A0A2P5ASZ4_PARAD|nr:hypothetical protein PanWU01x14_303910 [Parasponia andersonii]